MKTRSRIKLERKDLRNLWRIGQSVEGAQGRAILCSAVPYILPALSTDGDEAITSLALILCIPEFIQMLGLDHVSPSAMQSAGKASYVSVRLLGLVLKMLHAQTEVNDGARVEFI